MEAEPSNSVHAAALDAASAARGRAMTAFEEHLADAVASLAQAVAQLDRKLDAVLAAQQTQPAQHDPAQER